MKKKLLLLFLVLNSVFTHAQTIPDSYGKSPEWNNILTFGGNGLETIIEMQKDSDENLYVLGNYYGETKIDDQIINSEGTGENIFLAKFDSSGNLDWITSSDSLIDGGIDAYQFVIYEQHICVLGKFNNGDSLSGRMLTSEGEANYFFAQYDFKGNLMEVITFESKAMPHTGTYLLYSDRYVTPRFTFGNNRYYVTVFHELYEININLSSYSLVKELHGSLKISDITYFNDKIFFTGYTGESAFLDEFYLNFAGSFQSLFYGALDVNYNVDFAYLSIDGAGMGFEASNGGKFSVKNDNLFLLGMSIGNTTLNNLSIIESSSYGFQSFIVSIDSQDGSLSDLRTFTFPEEIPLWGFHNSKFLFNQRDELSFIVYSNGNYAFLSRLDLNDDNMEPQESVDWSAYKVPIYGLNGEEINSEISLQNLDLSIQKYVDNSLSWKKEFFSENGYSSYVVDLVSSNKENYYSLLRDGRPTNNLFGSIFKTLVKVDFDNNIIWSKSIEGELITTSKAGEHITYFDNNLYLAGIVKEDIKIDEETISVTSNGENNVFVAKFSEDGTLEGSTVFALPDESNEDFSFDDVDVLSNGNVLITASSNYTTKVMLLNSNLDYLKSVSFESEDSVYECNLDVLSDDKICLVGSFNGDFVIYNEEIFNKNEADTSINGCELVIDLDEELNVLNVFNYGHFSNGCKLGTDQKIIQSKEGGKFLTGIINRDCMPNYSFNNIDISLDPRAYHVVFFAKLNDNNDFEWVQTIGGDLNYRSFSSAVDENGNLYGTGVFNDKLYINENLELESDYEDGRNSFLAKFNSDGELLWVKTMLSSSSIVLSNLSTSNISDELLVGGSFSRNVFFGDAKIDKAKGASKGFLGVLKSEESLNIENQIILKNLTIYPNPSNGVFEIDTSLLSLSKNEIYTQVLDLNGRIMYSKMLKVAVDSIALNLNNFSKGVYIVKLNDGVNTFSNKIIIE